MITLEANMITYDVYKHLVSTLVSDDYDLNTILKELQTYVEEQCYKHGFIESDYLNAITWTEELLEESKMLKLHGIEYYMRDGVWYYREDNSPIKDSTLTRTLNTIYYEGNHGSKNYKD